MKIPSKFNLMGLTWTVKLDDPGNGNLGSTNFKQQLVRLVPDQSSEGMQATFLHELIHIIVYSMGLDKAMNLNPDQEEVMVNTLSNGLFAAVSIGLFK